MGMVSVDGSWSEKYNRLRGKSGETEKITINVGFVDLVISICWCMRASTPIAPTSSGRRSATSSPPHADAVKQSIVRHTLELGLRRYSREELEAAKAFGGKLHIQVVGLATIAEDVTPELALATIEFNHRPWRSSRQQSSQGSAL
jgi:hypothetical protein